MARHSKGKMQKLAALENARRVKSERKRREEVLKDLKKLKALKGGYLTLVEARTINN